MALTLIEAAKINSGDVLKSSIIELYARNSDILLNLPFEGITGNALRYNREDKLPGVGFRGVNEAYTESTGVINPQVESLVIAGGDLDVDKFIMDTHGPDVRATHEAQKVRALALRWTKAFVKGDADTDPRELDGLQKRVTGAMLVENVSAGTGVALSLGSLDAAVDQVINPTHIVMNKTVRRLLTAAARTTTVAGFINFALDAFGRRVYTYNDLPILIVDEDEAGAQIMPFTEAAGGGGSTSTSIYVVSFGDSMLTGIQNGDIQVRDLGELETKPAFRTRVEWYSGIAIYHGRAVSRLRGITNAAVVA